MRLAHSHYRVWSCAKSGCGDTHHNGFSRYQISSPCSLSHRAGRRWGGGAKRRGQEVRTGHEEIPNERNKEHRYRIFAWQHAEMTYVCMYYELLFEGKVGGAQYFCSGRGWSLVPGWKKTLFTKTLIIRICCWDWHFRFSLTADMLTRPRCLINTDNTINDSYTTTLTECHLVDVLQTEKKNVQV